ncbi:MAG: acetate kinase [Phycisphaeraceae bacterium]|nr:acetate kinase [Phycisphaeraceae bacterium]
MPASAHVLCLNSGSSSLKFSVYSAADGAERCVLAGSVEGIGLAEGRIRTRAGDDPETIVTGAFANHGAATRAMLDAVNGAGCVPDAAGHRVVHGGPDHDAPEVVTPALRTELRDLVPFAPLHLPSAIDAMDAVAEAFPGLPQVACFDTAFHRHMPELGQRLPLPRSWWDEGVRRYGFHGLSYEYVVDALQPRPDQRSVILHLGSGSSAAAVRGRQPVDTSMGLTPTGGFMMATRCGDLDPGVVLHLLERRGLDAAAIDRIVNRESGLLGVSGISSDMKTLLDCRDAQPNAAQAVALFCYQVRKCVGALAAVLGGLDALVFTGGIGERAAPVRLEICEGLEHLGVRVDPERNARDADTLSPPDAPCAVLRVETNEDLMIARHTREWLGG